MQHFKTNQLDLAFVQLDTPRFSELIVRVSEAEDLSDIRKRDMVSGLRRVAAALNLPPQDVPCDARWLQPRLAKVNPLAIKLTRKAWQNVLSDTRSAMAWGDMVTPRNNHRRDLSTEWRGLWDQVLMLKDITLSASLARFVHFLNRTGVAPSNVEQNHILAYRDALAMNEISKSPDISCITALNGWNLATRRIPEWPQMTFNRPSRVKRIGRPVEDFPATFQAAFEAFLARLQTPDPFCDHDGAALRPATIDQYRVQLLRFASELAASGVPVKEITDLAVLVDPVMAERGLRQMLARNAGQTNKGIFETAALLRNVCRKLGMPVEAQTELARLAKRLAPKKAAGMTTKNRQRLRVLQNDRQQQELLHLPEQLFRRGAEAAPGPSSCMLQEDALAIAILLVCPLRIKNVAGIHLDHNIHRPGDGRAFLVISESESKTERPMEFELPADVRKMIDRYLTRRSPHRCPAGTRWLFSRRDGSGPIEGGELSVRISRRIRRETGLEMNAHLFRHFAVMLWLDANPGAYEAARRLLGHSAVSHTINMYSGMEGQSAIRAFAELVTQKKNGKGR